MIVQEILGILLISVSLVMGNFIHTADRQANSGASSKKYPGQPIRQVLGASKERADNQIPNTINTQSQTADELFPTDIYIGAGNQTKDNLIKEQKIVIYPEDRVSIFPDPSLGIGFVLKVKRALAVKIDDGGKKYTVRTFQTKVDKLLEEKDIALGEKDVLNVGKEDLLKRDMEIKITRVSETEITIHQKISFKTRYQDDTQLEKGLTRLVRAGQQGEEELVYLVRRENGREVDRKLLRKKILKKPQDKIIARGTKEVVYGSGVATWFGAPKMTAAHNTLPRGTMVRVTNLANGKSVVVKIIGPGIKGRAIIDLSPDAFSQLASLRTGVIKVRLTKP